MVLVQQLQQAYKECRLPEALNKLSRYPLLILDDVGYVKKDVQETSVLFELIAERYETGSLSSVGHRASDRGARQIVSEAGRAF